jgi:CHASE3 domain sensor protein
MSQESEKFLEAEQSAQQLVETLTALKKETVSYKTSSQELDTTRQKLVGLIDSIENVAKDTHEIVKLIKSIGGPEILRSIESLTKRITEEFNSNERRIQQLKTLAVIGISIAFLAVIGIAVVVFK